MIRRPPRSTLSSSSAASDVYKRQEVPWEEDTSGVFSNTSSQNTPPDQPSPESEASSPRSIASRTPTTSLGSSSSFHGFASSPSSPRSTASRAPTASSGSSPLFHGFPSSSSEHDRTPSRTPSPQPSGTQPRKRKALAPAQPPGTWRRGALPPAAVIPATPANRASRRTRTKFVPFQAGR